MKKSQVAVPGALRAIEMVPALCLIPVARVLSWAMGAKRRTRTGGPPWIEPAPLTPLEREAR
jgi:hypothetical protein